LKFNKMISAVDIHAGLPMRVITGGVIDIPGNTVLEKKRWLETEGDELRQLMLNEPRGYPAMCCNLVVPACHPDADAGFIIMEHNEYPPMSGGNTITTATAILETGMLPMHEPVTEIVLESPAGLIPVRAECSDGKVIEVTFQNVPAYAVHLDAIVDVPQLGKVTVDVAWGGMFYVIAESEQFDLEITPENGAKITRIAEMLRVTAAEQLPVVHPLNPEFNTISVCMLSDKPSHPKAHLKNAVTMPTGKPDWDKPESWTGAIDRCPCGTGTCAKMAVMHAKGQLAINEDFIHESITGTIFRGRLIEETRIGSCPAVVPTISGQAWIYGLTNYVLDPTDPFPRGYKVGDIW
jgi:proline racemase